MDPIDEIRRELDDSRSQFQGILESLTPDDWSRPSRNPAWTNGQLLFHIALGFFLVLPLVRILRLFAVLPPAASKFFARVLNAATPLFNWINAIGPKFGARIFGRRRLGRTFDRVHARILRTVDSISASDWQRGMHYPVRWEPRFSDFMTLEKLLRYPTVHFEHHRTQLTLARGAPYQPIP